MYGTRGGLGLHLGLNTWSFDKVGLEAGLYINWFGLPEMVWDVVVFLLVVTIDS